MKMKFNDRLTIGEVKELEQGYLVATARVARTGVQEYLAHELGDIARAAGFKDNDKVRVYRHPDQVFSADSLATITRMPVTVDHPLVEVTAKNWGDLAVGEIGDAYTTEAEWVVVNPMIKDAQAAQLARTTHKELSMGYSAEIVPARDGLDADFEQTNIRYNHLALVPLARAGDKARIGDSWGASPVMDFQQGEKPNLKGGRMELKTVVLGDKAVKVAIDDFAEVEKFKTEVKKEIEDERGERDRLIAEKDEEIGRLRAELAEQKKDATVDIDELVRERAELVERVRDIDSRIEPKGKSDDELRRDAVASRLGDAMVKDASAAEIKGMFKAIVIDSSSKSRNPAVGAIQSGNVMQVGDAQAGMQAAWQKANADQNAWRNQ